jgi:hypothetical protein
MSVAFVQHDCPAAGYQDRRGVDSSLSYFGFEQAARAIERRAGHANGARIAGAKLGKGREDREQKGAARQALHGYDIIINEHN